MADGGGDDGVVVFEISVAITTFFLEFSDGAGAIRERGFGEDASEVGSDGGFFGDDEELRHGAALRQRKVDLKRNFSLCAHKWLFGVGVCLGVAGLVSGLKWRPSYPFGAE